MQKLTLPLFVLVLAIAVSCGASDKETESQHTAHTQGVIAQSVADTIVVGTVNKTEEEWKEILTEDEYHILRERGTEPAFSSDLLKVNEEGIFVCAACGLPLFSSEDKFDSGTGWPSFTKPIDPKVVKEVKDTRMGMVRIEIVCAQCGSHIGHVFEDGPEPTGIRYCMNGLALDFKAI